jgi:hypothetical protein
MIELSSLCLVESKLLQDIRIQVRMTGAKLGWTIQAETSVPHG